ncbi:hypothetical protein [Agromyces bauzanensis]
MGMDVYGNAPTGEVGSYFRNNVWWWRPLAEFVTESFPEQTEGCTYWHSNDGDGLDGEGAIALADALDAALASGAVAEYATTREATLAALPMEPCEWCHATGIRTDEVGRRNGLDKPRDPVTGTGGCNACSGTGQREPFARSYAFSEENVREFAAFVRASGGFAIC